MEGDTGIDLFWPPARKPGAHTCPKWAFTGLCHDGEVKGVRGGSAPESLNRESARYAREVLESLREEPTLAANKAELKRRVFGSPGAEGYRTPNDEVEVLLALWEAGLISGGPEPPTRG
jgi:hypothetical protein